MAKKIEPHQAESTVGYFQLCSAILCVLLVATLARNIDRPFTGLHSWGEAATAWRARTFLKYELSYTKGAAVWAVGDPPSSNPNRALDHPQLGLFLPAFDMLIFGQDEAGLRTGGIIRAVIALLIFLLIAKGLLGKETALLAGLFYVLFPITGYFGCGVPLISNYDFLLGLVALWNYLVITEAVKSGPQPAKRHRWLLAASLFFAIQTSWCGFFYAAAICIHYIFSCVRRRRMPEKKLMAILLLAPGSSLALNFMVMAAGHGWDWQKIWQLYTWRAGKGEMAAFRWGPWFAKMREYAVLNFTLPVLVIAGAYLIVGQLLSLCKDGSAATATPVKRFPQFWLLLMPGVLQMFVFKGSLWWHQFWQMPLIPFMAIAAALGAAWIAGMFAGIHRRAATAAFAGLLTLITVSCVKGVNYYYSIVDFPAAKAAMFKDLNSRIPPNEALLSYESFVRSQHPVKGPHVRPEVAWYLDRRIVQARSWEEIQRYAAGDCRYYLIPAVGRLSKLVNRLERTYRPEYIPAVAPTKTEDGRRLNIGMPPYMIFDLKSSRQ